MVECRHIAVMGLDQEFFRYKIDIFMDVTRDARIDNFSALLPEF
jgi:hypothetical protein